jgi:hypothetical protein
VFSSRPRLQIDCAHRLSQRCLAHLPDHRQPQPPSWQWCAPSRRVGRGIGHNTLPSPAEAPELVARHHHCHPASAYVPISAGCGDPLLDAEGGGVAYPLGL